MGSRCKMANLEMTAIKTTNKTVLKMGYYFTFAMDTSYWQPLRKAASS